MARTPSRTLAAVVMAAGKGKRLKSDLPKVLHPICGRPVLWHVLDAIRRVKPDPLVLVVSHGKDEVRDAVGAWGLPNVHFVDQGEPLGTGHAVMVAEDAVAGADDVLVLPGDNPLVTESMLRDLLRVHRLRRATATIQTTTLDDPSGYGRMVREGDRCVAVVEEREATPTERKINEIATCIYAFRREDLFRTLPAVDRDNRQNEYYLPDVIKILVDKGEDVRAVAADFGGALDVNSRGALARATTVMRRRINEDLMAKGITLIDPDRTYVDVGVRVGAETVIHPDCHLEGTTKIGRGCTIGPSSQIIDSRVSDGGEIRRSVLREARVGPAAVVGPFAHLRPGTILGPRAKVGSFVEIKSSRIGEGSKVPHLSYIGDAEIGSNVNVGAGTITCNYDGVEKHKTVIEDGAFIGSDTMLVAPVRIGRNAVTGAGSVITEDVPAGALAVERAEQQTIEGYSGRRKRPGR